MNIMQLPERSLLRCAHRILADPSRDWVATDGTVLQVVAAGRINVHEGPDLYDVAVLHAGEILIGDAEFHVRSSDWHRHAHASDPRYRSLLLHVVLEEDDAMVRAARWTVVVSVDEVAAVWKRLRQQRLQPDVAVEELQHFAVLRLLRQTADAAAHVRRLGREQALAAMAAAWAERYERKRRRPSDQIDPKVLAGALPESALGNVVLHFSQADPGQILAMLDRAERVRIANEGAALRREVLTNVILPVLCAIATPPQRVVLFQWYWSTRAVHPYGMLRRRFPEQAQDQVWQQQGMLEFLREHGQRTTTCGEVIRRYGLESTVQFLRAEVRP